ncbi:MAG TPA: PASTA domain-containing protein, partial [Candidatus Hydrogenedens sp.]|nr:PASTA domain-containing protein [Candidatus Hydrogenedens sp.]
ENAIVGAGLTVGLITQECNDTVPSGDVVSQDPLSGQQVVPSTAVNLVVSTGPCPVTVPNVVGMAQNSAEDAIVGAGLTVGLITQECSDTVPSGDVISQDPLSGQQVLPGTAVNLVVSTGLCPEGEGSLEGTPEGTVEGEGTAEGSTEGVVEGTPEGVVEGTPEGVVEGNPEGIPEGVVEGEEEKPPHSADQDGDWKISLSELLRVIQFFNMGGYYPCPTGEDGYCPGIIK